MTLQDLQPGALAALDAAFERACAVVDPDLLASVTARIEWLVAGAPEPPAPSDVRSVDVAAVVMAAYIVEARTRLRIAADRLVGGVA